MPYICLTDSTNCTPCTTMSKLCTLLGGTAATSTWDINRSGVGTGTQQPARNKWVCFQRLFVLAFCHIQSKPKHSAYSCSSVVPLGTARTALSLPPPVEMNKQLHHSNNKGHVSINSSASRTHPSHHFSWASIFHLRGDQRNHEKSLQTQRADFHKEMWEAESWT